MVGVVKVVEGLGFHEYGQEKFTMTLNELRTEHDTVKKLGLLD